MTPGCYELVERFLEFSDKMSKWYMLFMYLKMNELFLMSLAVIKVTYGFNKLQTRER